MPAVRQHVRCSARLGGCPPVHCSLRAMDSTEPSISRFQPPPPNPKPKMTIQWQSDDTLTDALVTWLTEHPPDCRILFYSDGKKSLDSNSSDRPSGKDKSQIYAVITQVIFESHLKYGSEYVNGQKKFRDSVNNRITRYVVLIFFCTTR